MSREKFLESVKNGHPNARTRSHVRAEEQEQEWAEKVNGEVIAEQAGSKKGDVSNGLIRLECKTTGKKSFSITRDMIRKIEDAAIGGGEIPAIVVEFNCDGAKECEVVVMPTWAFQTLVEKADAK